MPLFTNTTGGGGTNIPIGGVIAWFRVGSEAVPTGFQLCDGSLITEGSLSGNNTPNLVNKFIRGTDLTGTTNPPTQSGADTHRHINNSGGGTLSNGGAFNGTDSQSNVPVHLKMAFIIRIT